MADLLGPVGAPDWGEIENGNMQATADAIFLLWAQIKQEKLDRENQLQKQESVDAGIWGEALWGGLR